MQPRSSFLSPIMISLGLAVLSLSVSCLEPQRSDYLEHQHPGDPYFHPQ